MRRVLLVALSLSLSLGLALAAPVVASADTTITVEPSTASVEYGEAWEYSVAVAGCGRTCTTVAVRRTGGGESVRVPLRSGNATFSENTFGTTPLDTGDYILRAVVGPAGSQTASSSLLTITPAAIDVDVRIVPDANHPTGAAVIAQLSGAYLERIHAVDCRGCADVGAVPSGTWDVAITRDDGEEVFARTLQTTAAESENVSLYWQGVDAGRDYSVRAEFLPSTNVENFTITAESDVPFEAPDAFDVDDAGIIDALPATVQQPSGPTLPLWALLAAALILLVLLVTCALLVVRIVRSYRREPVEEAPVPFAPARPATAELGERSES